MGVLGEAGIVTPQMIKCLNKAEVVHSDVRATIPDGTVPSLPRFLLDLACAVAGGSLQPDKLVVAVRSAGVDASAEALGTDLADALWYSWQEVEGDTGGDAKTRVADAAKEALKEQLVTKQQLFESGEGEFFEWCGLVVSKDVWRRKEIRSHTKHVYLQRKFNLLREESEGYAKLATLLNQQAAGCLSPTSTAAALAEMKALIGYFDLDPNRCVSVVLDAFTHQPANDAFLGLMPAFSAAACSQVLGWHFYRCREDGSVQPPRPAQPAPTGLYLAAAKMIQAGYTSLETLMAHLSPADEELRQAYAKGEKRMRAGIARIGIISLISTADTASAAPLGVPPGLGLLRETSGLIGAAAGTGNGGDAGQQPKARSGLEAALLELSGAAYAAPLVTAAAGNQKLLLLAAFLEIGDWEQAQALMRWLRALGLSDFAAFPAVGQALCKLIGWELRPVYAIAAAAAATVDVTARPLPDLRLPARLLELLVVAGQHLYHDISVLTKLVRVLAATLAGNGSIHPTDRHLHEQVLQLLTQSVLPAMSLVPGNAALVYEVWAALSQLPYTDRFCLYADLKEGAKGSPLLTAGGKLAETEVRRILRRVTAPANKKEAKATMKPLGRMLAKIMHAAPLPVAEQLIRQVMGMPGMVTSIVESLKYLTPMAFDVMTFAVLKQLASPKKKLKDDGVNLEEWYQWLAAFTGLLCKKHGEVEVVCLLQYVANQLKSSESLDLLVLKEMVQMMTGHQAVFDVGEHQLDALAGSDTLKGEVITQGEHRSSDKSLQRASARLLAALQQGESAEKRLAMPLLVLLAQQRKLIVLQSQSTHLKLIAELYDKCQEVYTQYAEFLQHALPLADYAALLPSMEELATEYCIDPELIFSLYRPLIRSIEPPGLAAGLEHEEEGEIAEGVGAKVDMGGKVEGAAAGQGSTGGGGGAGLMEEEGEVAASPADRDGATAAEQVAVPGRAAQQQRWEELEQQVHAMHGGSGAASSPPWRGMTATLYTTFWVLQLYDLEVPVARYEATIGQLRTDIRITQGDIETARRDAQRPPHYGAGHGVFGMRGPPPPPAVTMGPAVDVEQLQKDIERSQAALDKLPGELKAQQANAATVERRLQREKGGWVAEGVQARMVLPREFTQYCLLPRMLNSPTDALYCARFLKKVHQLDVPGFNLLTTINFVMREFGFLVRVCTSREATNFGIFLNEIFAMVERWRLADVFARECAIAHTFRVTSDKAGGKGKAAAAGIASKAKLAAADPTTGEGAAAEGGNDRPAAADSAGEGKPTAASAADAPAAAAATDGGTAGAAVAPRNVDHREWLNLCTNWQKKLTDEVFTSCLRSRDYMQAKNALLALNRCVKVYPAMKHDASLLIELLKPIRDKDPREDLKTLARMYCTALEMQMRDKARNMVATREEYAGMPPKKRPRPATSKPTAAASQGKAPAATKEGGEKDKAAAEGEKRGGGSGDKEKEKTAAAKDDRDPGKRTTDSSKGPSLPPGMGMARRGEQPPGSRERERRAAPESAPPGFGSTDKLKHAGSSNELRHSTGEAAAACERERRERERERQPQERRAAGGGAVAASDRPPRPSGRGEEAGSVQAREQRDKSDARDGGTAALRPEAAPFVPRESGRLGGGGTRPAEEPAVGEHEAKRARHDEPAAASVAAAAAGAEGGSKERERGERRVEQVSAAAAAGKAERGSAHPRPRSREGARAGSAAAGEREREPRSRERPSNRDEAAAGGDAGKEGREQPGSGGTGRRRGKEEEKGSRQAVAAEAAAVAGRERVRGGEQPREGHERPGSSRDRDGGKPAAAEDAGPGTKRKRDEEAQVAAAVAAERPGSRAADGRERVQRERELGEQEREWASREPRETAQKEKRAAEQREGRPPAEVPRGRSRHATDVAAASAAADVEGARAAAKAAITGREWLAPPMRDRKGSGAAAGAAAASAIGAGRPGAGSMGGSSGSEDERGGRRHKRGHKEKEKDKKKKERKDKKHRRRDRSSEHGGSEQKAAEVGPAPGPVPAPVPAPAEERRRQPIPVPPVPQLAAPEEEEDRGSKRRRREEAQEPELPARLRGRLGGGLLSAALKGIAHDHEHDHELGSGGSGGRSQPADREAAPQPEEPRRVPLRHGGSGGDPRKQPQPARQAQCGAQGQQQQEPQEFPERQVREVRDSGRREVRRGGPRTRR